MATKRFTDFDVRTVQTLSPEDYVVGYKSDASAELRTQVRNITYVPYVEVQRSPAAGNQQRINNSEYLFEWNVKNFETNSTVLNGDASSYNIVINQTGFYEVEARYSAYDLHEADYMLMRLRGSTAPIVNFTDNLLELLDSRAPGVTPTLNGIATSFGRTIVRITSVPYYLVVSYQAGGGAAEGGTAYYTVAEETFGNIPRLRVRKLSGL